LGYMFCYVCNMLVFVFSLYSTYERKHAGLAFWTWLTSLIMMFSSSIHLPANGKTSFFFGWINFHCVWIPHFLNPFISSGASWLFP
jgi:hypothetical protein